MPFYGVLPERVAIFQPQPACDVGVNDAHAWRLNPEYRRVYDKLWIALNQGVTAAPVGVSPMDMGFEADERVFVKPITNLHGVSLDARAVWADAVPVHPGCFWSRLLEGVQTSTDCLLRDGKTLWFAHSRASQEKSGNRPVYWEIGVDLPEREPTIARLLGRWLPGYTGLCNLEMIGGYVIEAHLRGSNGFFDFYGPDFLPAWTRLVDEGRWRGLASIPGGGIFSLFGEGRLEKDAIKEAASLGVQVQMDRHTPGRVAVLRSPDMDLGRKALDQLQAALG